MKERVCVCWIFMADVAIGRWISVRVSIRSTFFFCPRVTVSRVCMPVCLQAVEAFPANAARLTPAKRTHARPAALSWSLGYRGFTVMALRLLVPLLSH